MHNHVGCSSCGERAITPHEREIAERDHEAIMRDLVGVLFRWDFQRSMIDLVFMKGLAAPRIAGLIGANRYLPAKPQKRYDDTAIMMTELVKHGHSSERGRQMIDRMNHIHSRFRIRQEDYIFVLTSFMFEPIRWNARFGWRPFSHIEKYAGYCFWREVGKRMQLTEIPDSYEACQRFNEDYEVQQLRRTHASVALAAILFRLLESWMPAPARPFVRPGLSALVDDSLLACFDVPPAGRLLKWLVPAVLRLRARALRLLPRRKTARYYADKPLRSYQHGYTIAELGPPDDWSADADRAASGPIVMPPSPPPTAAPAGASVAPPATSIDPSRDANGASSRVSARPD
jgi:hypothetical protein